MLVCELCVLDVPPLDNNQQIVWQCSEFSFAKKLFYVLPVGCQVATVAKSEFLLKCITHIYTLNILQALFGLSKRTPPTVLKLGP